MIKTPCPHQQEYSSKPEASGLAPGIGRIVRWGPWDLRADEKRYVSEKQQGVGAHDVCRSAVTPGAQRGPQHQPCAGLLLAFLFASLWVYQKLKFTGGLCLADVPLYWLLLSHCLCFHKGEVRACVSGQIRVCSTLVWGILPRRSGLHSVIFIWYSARLLIMINLTLFRHSVAVHLQKLDLQINN